MKGEISRRNLVSAGRFLYMMVAALECWLFLGTGALALLISLHLMPGDPSADWGPWHASLRLGLVASGLIALGIPAMVGLSSILGERFPMRATALWLAGIGMVVTATMTAVFFAEGWNAASLF